MKNLKFRIVALSMVLLFASSCIDDLNTKPKVEQTLESILENDPNAVLGLLSKIYGAYALSGPTGPDSKDIEGEDAGETAFLRGIINLQDFTADGLKNRWGDNGLDQLTTASNWSPNNKFFRYLYDRVYYTVPNCNNLISALNSTNIAGKEEYIAELRFLRSLAYYYMIDCFGKGVIVTEEDLGSLVPKQQSTRAEMFDYVESELLSVESILPLTSTYGRANKSVARMLLAKLYLNAKVYSGEERYNDAAIYIKKVIDEGNFSLATNFVSVFSGDNNTSPEIIFPIIADPIVSRSYGNATYLINGSISADTMTPSIYGINGNGWQGHRATKAWYGLFGASPQELEASSDVRAHLFWSNYLSSNPDKRHSYEMNDYKKWTDGYPCVKFRSTNFNGPQTNTDFSGTDFPMFRLADAYLMYAECALRGATSASLSQALGYVNDVRSRSNATVISTGELTLDFILDERARELNFEGHRRTDLIRFGKFTGDSYVWPWKGGIKEGVSISPNYNLFPIPTTALQANPNLTQNPGFN